MSIHPSVYDLERAMTRFTDKYEARVAEGKYVCVGLDPDPTKLPLVTDNFSLGDQVRRFLYGIIDATKPYAAAYKPQSAYYEALGAEGLKVLEEVILHLQDVSDAPIILDYKRGDIDRTSAAYAKAFTHYDVDAATINPYLGKQAMQPFLDYGDRTLFVLCRTSNPGGGEFQDLVCRVYRDPHSHRYYSTTDEALREDGVTTWRLGFDDIPLYQFVAHRVAANWNISGNCALVVGATYPEELKQVREIVGDMPILIPGLGTQGGDLAASIQNGRDSQGLGIVLNNSSAISFAFSKLRQESGELKYEPGQFREAAAEVAKVMNDNIAALVAT